MLCRVFSAAIRRDIVAKIIQTNKARQGRWGYQVLLVLVAGLALAGLVWLGLEFYGEAIETQNTDQPAADANQ